MTPQMRPILLLLLAVLPAAAFAQTAPASPAPAAPNSAVKLDEFVVTGVFNATEARKATTAITAVDIS
ncbi:MAG: hypothetical protein RLZZ221_2685, partial [Verrucomicrobiota bacterium]